MTKRCDGRPAERHRCLILRVCWDYGKIGTIRHGAAIIGDGPPLSLTASHMCLTVSPGQIYFAVFIDKNKVVKAFRSPSYGSGPATWISLYYGYTCYLSGRTRLRVVFENAQVNYNPNGLGDAR